MTPRRAITVGQLYRTNIRRLEFDGEWLSAIGNPEPCGSWIIWGQPGNGKTRFALQLAKYLATHGLRIAYDSLEEGISLSIREAIKDCQMHQVSRRFILLDHEPVADLFKRLEKKKSPHVVIIDSLQYTGLNYAEYKRLKDRFRYKLFIFISHAEGSQPAGRVARSIRFDANVKIWVEGFQAFAASRYGGGEPYMIWAEGAADLIIPKTISHEGDD